MHLSASFKSALFLLLTVTSFTITTQAQINVPAQCLNCLGAIISSKWSTVCKSTTLGISDPPSSMTLDEKLCFCHMTSLESNWMQPCADLGACTPSHMTTLSTKISDAKAVACASNSSTSVPVGGVTTGTATPAAAPSGKSAGYSSSEVNIIQGSISAIVLAIALYYY
ncbi:hypothetical protein FBU30_005647 [Linnemannia zychae]|nr:hypothetical protein FBU30_005647 [Linnemannia zychae]